MLGLIIFITILLLAWYGYWITLGILAIAAIVLPIPTATPADTTADDTPTDYAPESTIESFGTVIVPRYVSNSVYDSTPGAVGVDLYWYRNQYVLLATVASSANKAMAYNMTGQVLGSPIGGISGLGDGTMSDWHLNARYVRHVMGRTV